MRVSIERKRFQIAWLGFNERRVVEIVEKNKKRDFRVFCSSKGLLAGQSSAEVARGGEEGCCLSYSWIGRRCLSLLWQRKILVGMQSFMFYEFRGRGGKVGLRLPEDFDGFGWCCLVGALEEFLAAVTSASSQVGWLQSEV